MEPGALTFANLVTCGALFTYPGEVTDRHQGADDQGTAVQYDGAVLDGTAPKRTSN